MRSMVSAAAVAAIIVLAGCEQVVAPAPVVDLETPTTPDPEPEDPEPEDPRTRPRTRGPRTRGPREDPEPEDPEPEDPEPEDPEPEDPVSVTGRVTLLQFAGDAVPKVILRSESTDYGLAGPGADSLRRFGIRHFVTVWGHLIQADSNGLAQLMVDRYRYLGAVPCGYALEELDLGNSWSAMTNTFDCIITPDDRSMLGGVTFVETISVPVFDVSTESSFVERSYVFRAVHLDGPTTQVRVRDDFEFSQASELARRYMTVVGQMPLFLRTALAGLEIREGCNTWSASPFIVNIYISESSDFCWSYHPTDEETMIHEIAHIVLRKFGDSPEWQAATEADGAYITRYAESGSFVSSSADEDTAETLVAYIALRHPAARIGTEITDAIKALIPHRIAVLDAQPWDGQWCPVIASDCP